MTTSSTKPETEFPGTPLLRALSAASITPRAVTPVEAASVALAVAAAYVLGAASQLA